MAHPYDLTGMGVEGEGRGQVNSKSLTRGVDLRRKGQLLAIGPEGGWTGNELACLAGAHGFTAFSLGPRILKTHDATVQILGELHGLYEERV